MRLIRKLPPKYVNERCVSYAIFWCDFCQQEFERTLSDGKKAKSCGCVRNKLISKSNKGKPKSEEHIKNLSISHIGQTSWNKGSAMPEEQKQKLREASIGRIVTEETRQKISESKKGFRHSEGTRQKQSKAKIGKYLGENSPSWQGGKSFEIYPQEFKQIKKFILERDNYTCQDPNCVGNHKKLHVHHIDYDKTNNNPENLITLCISCHTKTNGKKNRFYWSVYYSEIRSIYL